MDLEVATEVRPKMIDPGAAPSPKSPIDPTYAMKEKDQNFNSKLAVNLLKTANPLLRLEVCRILEYSRYFLGQMRQ